MSDQGRVIVVTGGASGLGLGIAEALHARGATIVLLDRNAEALECAREKLGCASQLADVTDPAQVDQAIANICSELGVPTGLVNCAGVIRSAPLLNLLDAENPCHPLALWRETIDANLTSVFLMTRAVANRMARARVRGAIVNISSIAARGNAGQSAYAAAKAGVEALTRVWAKELGPLGLRFVAVAPGFIDTPSMHAALSDAAIEELKRETPLRRLGEVGHIVSAVLLALDNDMLTGVVLDVNGGLTL